jgi:hypothetical protein
MTWCEIEGREGTWPTLKREKIHFTTQHAQFVQEIPTDRVLIQYIIDSCWVLATVRVLMIMKQLHAHG